MSCLLGCSSLLVVEYPVLGVGGEGGQRGGGSMAPVAQTRRQTGVWEGGEGLEPIPHSMYCCDDKDGLPGGSTTLTVQLEDIRQHVSVAAWDC